MKTNSYHDLFPIEVQLRLFVTAISFISSLSINSALEFINAASKQSSEGPKSNQEVVTEEVDATVEK